jgi:hypothetical protein
LVLEHGNLNEVIIGIDFASNRGEGGGRKRAILSNVLFNQDKAIGIQAVGQQQSKVCTYVITQ